VLSNPIVMPTISIDRQEKLAPQADSARSARMALAAAFASFAQTAGALETTYTNLQAEVGRLRHELENKNRSLAQSLEENERMRTYLARIVEGLPCGVLVFDAEMNLRMMNPAASRLLKSGVEESSIPHCIGSLLATLPEGHSGQEEEWVVQGPEGERPVGVSRATVRTRSSRDESILILRDLTVPKQLEREREVSRRSQALAEVATVLAHEIRNPLGSLELFAGLLADALSNQPELQPWIGQVQAGLRALAATVNNVLHFHSQPAAQLLRADLCRLVGDTVEFLRPLARQREMQILWQAPGESIGIRADPTRLQQAFLNLALNAFRAMKPGGTLSITVRASEGHLNPTVATIFADQGCGIRVENLEKIFDPGFTTQEGSPGLGLAVTRKVVEQHGGSICVESREGQGTTFKLLLPLNHQERGESEFEDFKLEPGGSDRESRVSNF
jgi:signal transduction histidine kinase